MRKKNLVVLIPIGLFVLNFILKFLYIDAQSIAGDEPFSIFHAQLNVSSIIEQLKKGNNPPLFEIILHYWIGVFGISTTSVRFLPLLFSSLNVLFIYKIGKSFFNLRVAIVASLLFTFSNYHIFFSHECRVYSLFALLTTISMYAFFKIQQEGTNRIKYLTLMTLSNILLIFSHYFGFWVIFIQFFLALVFKSNRKQLLKYYSIGILILIVAYIPMWRTFFERFFLSSSEGTWLKAPKDLGSLYFMLWEFSNKPIATIVSILLLIASIVKFFIKKDYKSLYTYQSNIWIITWFFLPFLLMFTISFKVPMFHDRYLIYLSIAFYILLAICVDYILPQFKYKYILDAILLIMFIVTFNPNVDNQRHVRETVEKVKELKDDHTLVIISPYFFMPNFTYYYNQDYFKLVNQEIPYQAMDHKLQSENIYAVYGIKQITEEKLNQYNKVVFLDAAADFANPNNNIRNTLNSKYRRTDKFFFYEIFNVVVFEK